MVSWTDTQIAEVVTRTHQRLMALNRGLDTEDALSAAHEGVVMAMRYFDEKKVKTKPISMLKRFAYLRAVDALRLEGTFRWRCGMERGMTLGLRGNEVSNHENLEEHPDDQVTHDNILYAEELLSRLPRWEKFFILDCMQRPIVEIASCANLSYSRVIQIRDQILNKLREIAA